MLTQLSDYLLISDMDGTLLNRKGVVPPRNREALEGFVAKGGRFGIATGRSKGLMREAAEGLPVNGPCILYNGGAVYDFAADRILFEEFLPDSARDYIREIMGEMRDIDVLVIQGDSYYQVKEERSFASFFEARNRRRFYRAKLDSLGDRWYKVLFQVLPERTENFFTYVSRRQYPGVRFVGTGPALVEMLPERSSKGAALQKILDQGIVNRAHLVAVGDYYNDVEMLELAGIGITLETSPADLRRIADVVVGDCDRGAVADAVAYLERLCSGPISK